jgi:hypothetical protein
MNDLINRGDALAVVMYGTDKVEGIKNLPAADAVEVVHAKWVYYKKKGIAVCSACSFERKLDYDFGKAISCPNCGARCKNGW